jgi:hypothetical protein
MDTKALLSLGPGMIYIHRYKLRHWFFEMAGPGEEGYIFYKNQRRRKSSRLSERVWDISLARSKYRNGRVPGD